MTQQPYSLSTVRAVTLHAQMLGTPPGGEPEPTPDAIYDVAERLLCVQIDTLQMVHRSHYLVMWSRLGSYDPADFDRLVYTPGERRLFEYWQHAASLIPLTMYRYKVPKMRWFREEGWRRDRDWRAQPENAALYEAVLDRIRSEGGLRTSDFEHDGKSGSWWGWKPAKRALENGYNLGELMIAGRVNFQRVYDLAERVLPGWVDITEATHDEANRFFLDRAARAVGVAQVRQVADYVYMRRGSAQPYLDAMLDEGVLVPVQAKLVDGETAELVIHRDNLPLLAKAADGALRAERTTFLSPFDSLFWADGRDQQFWNFRKVLEAYKPADQREWGYFCLQILHRDRLVGRFDPKLDRKKGVLYLRALYLEPGIEPDDELVSDVAVAMRDFLAFHGADDLVIERSEPEVFGAKLSAAL